MGLRRRKALLPFVLLGDSGEQDPEIYGEIVSSYPGRILAVYIRDVSGEPRRGTVAELAQHGFQEVPLVEGVPERLPHLRVVEGLVQVVEARDVLQPQVAPLHELQVRVLLDGVEVVEAQRLDDVDLALLQRVDLGLRVDADVTTMLNYNEMWIVPLVNPDGRLIVEQGGNSPYLQRKNANNTAGACSNPPTSTNQHGVDLNRNANFKWGGLGTSTSPCTSTVVCTPRAASWLSQNPASPCLASSWSRCDCLVGTSKRVPQLGQPGGQVVRVGGVLQRETRVAVEVEVRIKRWIRSENARQDSQISVLTSLRSRLLNFGL